MRPKHFFLPALLISAFFIVQIFIILDRNQNLTLAEITGIDTTTFTTTPPTTNTTSTLPITSTLPTTTTTDNTTTTLPTTSTTTASTTTLPTTTTTSTTTLPTTTTSTLPTTTTTTDSTTTTLPTTSTTTASTTTLPTTTTSTLPTTTASTTTLPTTTTSTLPTTTTTTATDNITSSNTEASTNTDTTILPQFEFFNIPTSPITTDQKICVHTNQVVEKVTYRISGTQVQYISAVKTSELEYCSQIKIANLTSGEYKLTAIATGAGKNIDKTIIIKIKKPETVTTTQPEPTNTSVIAPTTTPIANKCQTMGITNETECRQKILAQYTNNITCQNSSGNDCINEIATESNMEKIIAIQDQYQKIETKSTEILNRNLSVETIEEKINDTEEEKIVLPIREKNTKIISLPAKEEIRLENGEVIQTAPIITIIDSDGDGLPDDTERRLGTNPNSTDSDGDGYDDKEEITNGYNPLGAGKIETAVSPIEKAIITGKEIEHPKASGEQKENFLVEKIENAPSENGYTISGKCEPNTIATLYIYSDIPVITTVSTDQYGNWQYEFKESLEDGEHEIYVAINDDTGKVISKSNPLSFIVQEAKAVSAGDLDNIKTPLQTEEKESDSMMTFYITFAGIIIIIGILVAIFLILNKKKISQQ